MREKTKLLNSFRCISPYEKYCDGYGSPGSVGKNYVIGFVLGTGESELSLKHDGSQVLDEINAFDRSEVSNVNIGQINMITVSSFCGPAGLIWGYDLARVRNVYTRHAVGKRSMKDGGGDLVQIYSIAPLLEATKRLLGTVDKKRFPILPGAHVACAGKNIKCNGEKHIYAAIALGIANERNNNACLLMEDLGWIPLVDNVRKYRGTILDNIAKSVIEVGKNQNVKYCEIFTGMIDVKVKAGKVGCALVAAPYLTLAQKAIPNGGFGILQNMTLENWEKSVEKDFLDK